MNAEVVLDASAVLALLQEEPGSRAVAAKLSGAAMSAVNMAEVVTKLSDAGMPERDIRHALAPLGIDVHPFDEAAAYSTGMLRARTKSLGLSLGDRACLALGLALSRPVLTTERSWTRLRLEVPVVLAR